MLGAEKQCLEQLEVAQVNYHVSKYTEIIKDLRSEIQELKALAPVSTVFMSS